MMRKMLFITFVMLISLTGCTAPGTYMAGNLNSNSVKDKLLHSYFIPINSDSMQKGYLRNELSLDYHYHVGPYDVLSIVVWNHPELTLSATSQAASAGSSYNSVASVGSPMFAQSSQLGIFVDSYGNIVLPLIGPVNVSGLSTDQIASRLEQKFSRYIRNPKIIVQVTNFSNQRINVIGEVNQPGPKPLADRPLSILDAINLCGGINPNSADAAHIYVIRGGVDKAVKVYWLSAKSPDSLLLAQRFHLSDNDIVYVSTADIALWNRVVSQILPSVQTFWNTWSMVRTIK